MKVVMEIVAVGVVVICGMSVDNENKQHNRRKKHLHKQNKGRFVAVVLPLRKATRSSPQVFRLLKQSALNNDKSKHTTTTANKHEKLVKQRGICIWVVYVVGY